MKALRLSVLVAASFLGLAPSGFAQAKKALDVRMADDIARAFPEWKPKDSIHVFQPNSPSSGNPVFFGYWKDGERNLAVYVTLTTSQAELDERFNMFFRRQIMPASRGVDGIGTRAVLVETSRTVEIGFAKENLFVTVNYDFPAPMNTKIPYYYLPAPKTETARLTAITRIVAGAIDGPKTATACLNDFYDTSATTPTTDEQRMVDAASKGDTASVSALLAAGTATGARDEDGNTPLHLAVRVGCAATAQTLIEAKADVNAKNVRGETPLMLAAMFADRAFLELLLKNGADVAAKDRYGRTAVFFPPSGPDRFYFMMRSVSAEDRATALELLKNAGSDMNGRMENGDTLLTSFGFWPEMLTKLIALGADINGRGSTGQTLLIRAVQHGTPSDRNPLIKLLLSLGADPSIKDERGQTAMDYILLDQKNRARSPEYQPHLTETIHLLENATVRR
jgi:hypothetical protein